MGDDDLPLKHSLEIRATTLAVFGGMFLLLPNDEKDGGLPLARDGRRDDFGGEGEFRARPAGNRETANVVGQRVYVGPLRDLGKRWSTRSLPHFRAGTGPFSLDKPSVGCPNTQRSK